VSRETIAGRQPDDLALELPSGRLTGLIRPDEVGKSKLLGIIAGVRQIQSGRVEVLGHAIVAMTVGPRRSSWLPQGAAATASLRRAPERLDRGR
jgi:ABC-type sulfate/molybdate transport systems ATPase subunit